MPRNVEIKAFVTCMSSLRSKAAELSKSDGVEIKQSDTFFTTNQGRLKLRHLIGTDAQLVYYDRSDKEGPKLSDYHIVTTDQPEELSKVLSKALGVRGEVSNVQNHVALLKAVLSNMPFPSNMCKTILVGPICFGQIQFVLVCLNPFVRGPK